MLAKARAKYIRMSARKVRYILQPLRQRTVGDALAVLASVNRRAAKPVAKAIASAFANAKRLDATLGEDQVVISRLIADGGPSWKRFRAAAFGRAVPILKRTTHITVELERKNGRAAAAAVPSASQPPASAATGGTRPSRRPRKGT